jgi:RimJ/RimL family protein N-acetyltransferase
MIIKTANVSLVSFEPNYSRLLYEIRNHESVRKGMRDTREIPWESHQKWVEENLLKERKQLLFIVFYRDEPVGIALLRDFKDDSAEIGILIKESRHHPVVAYRASYILAIYAFYHLDIPALYSYVSRHNQPALAFNLKCGFKDTGADNPDYYVLRLEREISRTSDTHRKFGETHRLEIIE